MSEHNGSAQAPTKYAVRHTAKLVSNAITLAELQAELIKIEAQQRLSGAVKPGVLLITAVCLALGCIPVLLLSLAYFLTETAGLPHALSLLIATGLGLLCSVGGVLVAIRGFKKSVDFNRSKDEFSRNVAWIKQVLKHKCNPAYVDCGDDPISPQTTESLSRS